VTKLIELLGASPARICRRCSIAALGMIVGDRWRSSSVAFWYKAAARSSRRAGSATVARAQVAGGVGGRPGLQL
jgi:hypothetical protein